MTAEKVRGPRNYIEHFGTAEACAKVAVSAPPLEMSRAWAQHRLVVALHADLRRIGLTVEDFIRTLGRNVRTLGEKMSGLSWVTLDDLVEITLFLGPTCVQEWGRLVEQTFPANDWPEPPGWRPGHLTLPSGGTAVRGAHWPSIAQEAQMLALTMRRSGTGHLIDDAQLGRLTREVLVGREVAASELQLRSEAGANVFDVGDDVSVAAVWGRDPVSSAARDELRRRVAVSVAGLVASKRDELGSSPSSNLSAARSCSAFWAADPARLQRAWTGWLWHVTCRSGHFLYTSTWGLAGTLKCLVVTASRPSWARFTRDRNGRHFRECPGGLSP